MRSDLIAPAGNREVRPIGVMRESPALHFYLMQAVAFLYLAYRFASRNYTVFGLLPADAFVHGRAGAVQFIPVSWVRWTTFQFLYDVVPRPGPEIIGMLQLIVVAVCLLGVAGIFPRVCAIVAFVVASHITGMMITASADTDGGDIVLCTMLILALSPARNFYSWRNGCSLARRSIDYHWPVVLLCMVVGAFYTSSGLNKLVDVGPQWPFVLHLDRLAARGAEQSLFVFSDYRNPWVASLTDSYLLSVVAGVVSLVGEVGFISILFLPRFRPFFAVSMSVMHLLVFLMAGINFVGSSAILFLCVDWNVLVRRATVVYDDHCSRCRRSIGRFRRWDWFHRLTFIPRPALPEQSRLNGATMTSIGLEDENGEVYYGADAVEQLGARCPLLWPYALSMKIPGAIYVARLLYAHRCAPRVPVEQP